MLLVCIHIIAAAFPELTHTDFKFDGNKYGRRISFVRIVTGSLTEDDCVDILLALHPPVVDGVFSCCSIRLAVRVVLRVVQRYGQVFISVPVTFKITIFVFFRPKQLMSFPVINPAFYPQSGSILVVYFYPPPCRPKPATDTISAAKGTRFGR